MLKRLGYECEGEFYCLRCGNRLLDSGYAILPIDYGRYKCVKCGKEVYGKRKEIQIHEWWRSSRRKEVSVHK